MPRPGQGPTQHRIERGVTGRPPRTVQRTSDAQVPFVGRMRFNFTSRGACTYVLLQLVIDMWHNK